ncbi:hypothetical protein C8K38_103250 [Rhodococcus sp. OK611]|nr:MULTISPECIES: hypothetical protein [unclassified Rhodococcus (in: high G+C Gram-positive bacteria)]PTR44753.1 hypothetical protein C8K38_103250 [Rhodococcus sp. OK611]SNX90194.1 hypothetical protein SAMN05447004_104250 [Rhodococcus sp. OK270]
MTTGVLDENDIDDAPPDRGALMSGELNEDDGIVRGRSRAQRN